MAIVTATDKLTRAQLEAAFEQQTDSLQQLDEHLVAAAGAQDLYSAKRHIEKARAELATLAKVLVRATRAHEGR